MWAMGIDLSPTKAAWAIVAGHDMITYQVKPRIKVDAEDHAARIRRANEIVGEIIDGIAANHDAELIIAIESGSAARRGGGLHHGEIMGILLTELEKNWPGHWFLVNPIQLKMFATNNSKADKEEIRLCVMKRWSFGAPQFGEDGSIVKKVSDDEVDAFVLAKMAEAVGNPVAFEKLTRQQQEVLHRCFTYSGANKRRQGKALNRQCKLRV